MITLSSTSELDIVAPPDTLFRLLEPERTPAWDRSIVSVHATRGPLGPGARYVETHRVLFRAHSISLEVTEYTPPLAIAFRTVSGGPPSTMRYELREDIEVTTVRASAEAQIGGPLVLLAPLLRRAMTRQLPKTLSTLKSYCDARSQRPPGSPTT